MALETNDYRRAWAAWLPGALPLLEAEQYAEALATFPKPKSEPVELAPVVPFLQRRMALITSGGFFDSQTQAPFVSRSATGDVTPRFIPVDLPDEHFGIAHGHYDEEFAQRDREVILPRRALRAAGATLTPTIVSYMGYNVDWPTFIEATIPQIIAQLRADRANCALLVPV